MSVPLPAGGATFTALSLPSLGRQNGYGDDAASIINAVNFLPRSTPEKSGANVSPA